MIGERIAIVGSRIWGRRWEEIKGQIEAFVAALPKDAVIVSGGAMGVDMYAVCVAQRRGLETRVHLPNWARDGRAAAFLRNRKIVDDVHRVVAWHNGESKGTLHTIELARASGKPVEIRRGGAS
jgi:hypothetical protein